jgi:hypothetical protein
MASNTNDNIQTAKYIDTGTYWFKYFYSFIFEKRRVNDQDTPETLKMDDIVEMYAYLEA